MAEEKKKTKEGLVGGVKGRGACYSKGSKQKWKVSGGAEPPRA